MTINNTRGTSFYCIPLFILGSRKNMNKYKEESKMDKEFFEVFDFSNELPTLEKLSDTLPGGKREGVLFKEEYCLMDIMGRDAAMYFSEDVNNPEGFWKFIESVKNEVTNKKIVIEYGHGYDWYIGDYRGRKIAINYQVGGAVIFDAETEKEIAIKRDTHYKAIRELMTMDGWENTGLSTGDKDDDDYYLLNDNPNVENPEQFLKTTRLAVISGRVKDEGGHVNLSAEEVLAEVTLLRSNYGKRT